MLLCPILAPGPIADVTFEYDDKNEAGDSLATMMSPLSQSKEPDSISVTILGAVKRPGIYEVSNNAPPFNIIQKAFSLSDHPVRTHFRKIILFRKGEDGKYSQTRVDARKKDKELGKGVVIKTTLKDGDTIDPPALVF